jgi:hypothetical protein
MGADCLTHSSPKGSPSVSATTAIAHLKRVRFLSAQEAIQRLATLADTGRILWLYRKYFPREYECSTASSQIPVSLDGECGYSEREGEFLRLVDQHLFPLPDLFFDESRFDMIPLYPQGVEWDDDPEYLRVSLRAGLELVEGEFSSLWEQWLPQSLHPQAGQLDWKKFTRRCRRVGGLAVRLPLLIELVSHNTDNLWLDVCWESGVQDFAWKEEDIEWLKKEWRAAQRFYKRLDALLDRMDKHPRFWLTRLIKLWNACLQTESARP